MKWMISELILLTVCVLQGSADWTGTGEIKCYGHVSTDVSTPEGGGFLERGKVTCSPIEWVYSTGLGPEAMFFHPYTGGDFEIWAWDYHGEEIPHAVCNGDIWYKKDDMGGGFCTPHKTDKMLGYTGCGFANCVGDITCIGC